MRLCTLRDGSRDGSLHLVHKDGHRVVRTTEMPPSLQVALDDWDFWRPILSGVASRFADGRLLGVPLDEGRLLSPLPRAAEWVDGSSFIHHIRLVRRARNAEPPEDLLTVPLVYQGGSSALLGPRDPIPFIEPEGGLDFESEVCGG